MLLQRGALILHPQTIASLFVSSSCSPSTISPLISTLNQLSKSGIQQSRNNGLIRSFSISTVKFQETHHAPDSSQNQDFSFSYKMLPPVTVHKNVPISEPSPPSQQASTPKPEETTTVCSKTKRKIIDPFWENPTPHPIYQEDELSQVQKTHHEPERFSDKVALFAVKCLRNGFDIASGYRGPGGGMTKRDWLNRCLFLETVAGVPGMVAGMCRHLKSLRTMQRDYGWIHTLLEEAENERMHLLIFMNMKNPNILFRLMVMGGQGVFFNMFFITYLFSPQTCHRFVGYLEEEAVKTYTGLLQDMDEGHLDNWGNEAASLIGARYYKLPENAVVRDVVACIRADEANHRDVNHTFAGLDPDVDTSPFISKYTPGTGSTPKRT